MKRMFFRSPEFGELRIGESDGAILFSVNDICNSMQLDVAQIISHLSTKGLFFLKENTAFTSLAGLLDIACKLGRDQGGRYSKWILGEVIPMADSFIQSMDEPLKWSEVIECLEDVVTDYPTCAIESPDADMELVHRNTGILSRFLSSMKERFNEGLPFFSPICK